LRANQISSVRCFILRGVIDRLAEMQPCSANVQNAIRAR
jgi:hypothetical protein